jgi:hypothetical protein
MTVKVEMFRSTSGNLFDTEHCALRDDLRGLLIDSGDVNEASAVKLVDYITGDLSRLNAFREQLERIAKTHPALPVDATKELLRPHVGTVTDIIEQAPYHR